MYFYLSVCLNDHIILLTWDVTSLGERNAGLPLQPLAMPKLLVVYGNFRKQGLRKYLTNLHILSGIHT